MTTYATFDPAKIGTLITLSNGNLTATCSGASAAALATIGPTSGKWYFEFSFVSGGDAVFGVADALAGLTNWLGSDAHGHGLEGLYHTLYTGGANVGSLTGTTVAGNVLGVGLDMDTGTVSYWGTGGTALGAGFTSGITGTQFPAVGSNQAYVITANFGATAFAYTVPTGYNAGVYTGGTGAALAGTSSAQATATSALTTAISFVASAAAIATATVALSTGIALAASPAASATTTSSLTTGIRLAATAYAQATATSALTTGIALASSAYAQASANSGLNSGPLIVLETIMLQSPIAQQFSAKSAIQQNVVLASAVTLSVSLTSKIA